jgi:hypothetical protein
MTYQGTVDPSDPRRDYYVERRTRQLLVAALRNDWQGHNEAWTDAFTEFGMKFAHDAVVAMPAILRQHLDDDAAEELAARVAEPIFNLAMRLENYLAGGGSHDTPDGAT